MKGKTMRRIFAAACLAALAAGGAPVRVEHETDVVVVGGGSAAVGAALAAKEAGARVLVLAPRPYLGEDVAGTLRLAAEAGDDAGDPLFPKLFPFRRAGRGMKFAYTADRAAAKAHPDPESAVLRDGKMADPATESVQYDGDVELEIDLGEVRRPGRVEVWHFARPNAKGRDGFRTGAVEVRTSADGKRWSAAAAATPTDCGGVLCSAAETRGAECRYLRLKCAVAEGFGRQLLAEVRVAEEGGGGAAEMETTPFAAKRAFDRALLEAGVPYMTGSVACGALKDANGKTCGVVAANRSGRQAILAKAIVDATPRARVAALAGGESRAFPAGEYEFTRMAISSEKPRGVEAAAVGGAKKVEVRHIKSRTHRIEGESRLWECRLKLAMAGGSAKDFAEAEQKARDLTYTPGQSAGADEMAFVPPDAFHGSEGELGAHRPKGTENVWVAGPRADVSRDEARRLMAPGRALKLGRKIGAAAAKAALGAAKAEGPYATVTATAAELAEGCAEVEIKEHRKGLPQYLANAEGEAADEGKVQVLGEVEVLVVGAGTGGAPAAIASARAGAKTLVVEYLHLEGGVSTAGLIGFYWFGNRVGFTKEIDAGTDATGAVFPQAKSEWYRSEQRKAGAGIWFGAFANGVWEENGTVKGVSVVMADGTRGLVKCAAAVDSTGNAELVAMAGGRTEFVRADELSVQGAGQARNVLGAAGMNSDVGFVDDTDAADLFWFALRSRLSMPEGTWDQAQLVNSRERRRMAGAFHVSSLDVVNSRTYPDTVVRTYSNFDTHGQTRDDLLFIQNPGHKPMYVNLPYRAMLPEKIDGVLVTGLGLGADRDAMPILRMQPDVQNQGYAAGTAAAMAVKAGVRVRDADVKELQRRMVAKGVITEEDANTEDSFPIPEDKFDAAVAKMAKGYEGLEVAMTDRARAIPKLRRACAAAEGEAKLRYAHSLAMMGDASAARIVAEKVAAMDWDKGWEFRGMGQFNRSVSWADSYLIALGKCGYAEGLDAVLAKAAQLTEKSEYSHFRAVALACEGIGEARAAEALAAVLRKPGIGGRWQEPAGEVPLIEGYSDKSGDRERTLVLRELCLARAIYNLGDAADGIGRRTLEAYARDPRRIYANHAMLALKPGPGSRTKGKAK